MKLSIERNDQNQTQLWVATHDGKEAKHEEALTAIIECGAAKDYEEASQIFNNLYNNIARHGNNTAS